MHDTPIILGLGGAWPAAFAGDPLLWVAARLAEIGRPVLAASRIWRSPGWTYPRPPSARDPQAGKANLFWNAAVAIAPPVGAESETPARLDALYAQLQRIETEAGRDRAREIRWGARPLDIDILAWGARIIAARRPGGLFVPHLFLDERRFALETLAEIAPDWHHPVSGLNPREMLARLPVEDELAPVEDGLAPFARHTLSIAGPL